MQVTYSAGRIKTTVTFEDGHIVEFSDRLSKKEAIYQARRARIIETTPMVSPYQVDQLMVAAGFAEWAIAPGSSINPDNSFCQDKAQKICQPL